MFFTKFYLNFIMQTTYWHYSCVRLGDKISSYEWKSLIFECSYRMVEVHWPTHMHKDDLLYQFITFYPLASCY